MRRIDANTNPWSPPGGGDDMKEGKRARANASSSSSSSGAPARVEVAPMTLRRSSRVPVRRTAPANEDVALATRLRERQVTKRKAERADDDASSSDASDGEGTSSDAQADDRKSAKKRKAVKSSAAAGASRKGKVKGPGVDLTTPLNDLLKAALPPAPRAGSARARPDIEPMKKAMREFFNGNGRNIKAARVGKGLRQLMPWIATLATSQRELVIEAFAATVNRHTTLRRVLPTLKRVLLDNSHELGDACAPTVRSLARALGPDFLAHDREAPPGDQPDSLIARLVEGRGDTPLWLGVLQALQDAQGDEAVDAYIPLVMTKFRVGSGCGHFFEALADLRGGRAMAADEALRIVRIVLDMRPEQTGRDAARATESARAWCNALASQGLAPAHARALQALWLEPQDCQELERRGKAIARALLGPSPTAANLTALVETAQRELPHADARRRAAVLMSTFASLATHTAWDPLNKPPAAARLIPEVVRLAAALLVRDGMEHAPTLLASLAGSAGPGGHGRAILSTFYAALLDQLTTHRWLADRSLACRLIRAAIPERAVSHQAMGSAENIHRNDCAEHFLDAVLARATRLSPDDIACLGQAISQALPTMGNGQLTVPRPSRPPVHQHPLIEALERAESLPADATIEALVRGIAAGVPEGEQLPPRLTWTALSMLEAAACLDTDGARAAGRGFAQGLASRDTVSTASAMGARSLMTAFGGTPETEPSRRDFIEAFFLALGGSTMDRRLAWQLMQGLGTTPAAPGTRLAATEAMLGQTLGSSLLARARADAAATWDRPAPSRPVREGKGDVPDAEVSKGVPMDIDPDLPASSSSSSASSDTRPSPRPLAQRSTGPLAGAVDTDPAERIDALLAEIRALPPLPATLPPLPEIAPAQRAAARLWLQLGEQGRRLPPLADGTAPTGAHVRLQEALEALQPFVRRDETLGLNLDAVQRCLREFEGRYAADLEPTDWTHDAIVLGWRLGADEMPAATRNRLILRRMERLRTLAAAPGAAPGAAPEADALLEGLLQAMVRPVRTAQPVAATLDAIMGSTLSLVFIGVAAPADAAARPALLEATTQALRWTCATLATLAPPSRIVRSLLGTLFVRVAQQTPDIRTWMTPEQAAQMLAAAARTLGVARDDPTFGDFLDALVGQRELEPRTAFTTARALRGQLEGGARPQGEQLTWAVTRLGQGSHAAPSRAAALAMGLCPSHGTARTLLLSMRELPMEQQVNLLRLAPSPTLPPELAALVDEIPRELATTPQLDDDARAAGTALTDPETATLTVAWAVASMERGKTIPPLTLLRQLSPRPAPPDAPPTRLERQTLSRHTALAVLKPWLALTEPALAHAGQGRLLDRICSLQHLQTTNVQVNYWTRLLVATLPSATKLEAASRLVRHAARFLSPAQIRAARLQLTEEFMNIAYATAPTNPGDERAQAEYTVGLVEAASHIAAVYDRLRDSPTVRFAYQPVTDPARQLEQVRANRLALTLTRNQLDQEIVAVSRPHVHERLRASLLPVLENLRAPLVEALARDTAPAVAAGEAAVDDDVMPLD